MVNEDLDGYSGPPSSDSGDSKNNSGSAGEGMIQHYTSTLFGASFGVGADELIFGGGLDQLWPLLVGYMYRIFHQDLLHQGLLDERGVIDEIIRVICPNNQCSTRRDESCILVPLAVGKVLNVLYDLQAVTGGQLDVWQVMFCENELDNRRGDRHRSLYESEYSLVRGITVNIRKR